jgi:arsenate reductase
MSKVKLYHNPRCSKSRQAKSLLDDRGLHYETIEYLNQPPSEQELASILTALKKSPLELMRTGEALFKELGLSKTDDRPDEEWIRIMVENPKLIERPIVVNGKKVALGRPPEDILNVL